MRVDLKQTIANLMAGLSDQSGLDVVKALGKIELLQDLLARGAVVEIPPAPATVPESSAEGVDTGAASA